LLHFVDRTAYIHRDDAHRLLRAHYADYEKNLVSLEFLEGTYETAKARAQQLTRKHAGDGTQFPQDNPSSDIWRLVESIGATY
jgi:hypothetical protein